ncbi:MAG: hypothetical protein HS123_07795 [Solibacteraceae bacterium]|nr:hypothetical protein [Solibacteraceae bacterium]
MKHTTRRTKTPANATPGFAIRIDETTELSDAFLIAEFDGGRYEPLGSVISIGEAKEIAGHNMRCRMRKLEAGGEPEPAQDGAVLWGPDPTSRVLLEEAQ